MPINPNKGESKDEFTSRCISIEIENGKSQEQAVAICISKAEEHFSSTASVTDGTWSTAAPISVNLESYTDYPKAAQEAAKTALRWADENGWGDCGTPVGKARANQLANGEPISRDTIARMAAFERHRQNSQKDLGDGCGRLMWLAWGGDAGIEWAQRKLEQIDKQNLSRIELAKISFDYDETLSTERGMALAKRLISEGNDLYIISARQQKDDMLKRAEELGIPASRVFATGSNKAKVQKVKDLNITKHYDNNGDVVKDLGTIGQKFSKVKKVLFNEDFDPDVAKKYKEMGFKVYIRSARKIKKKDKKVWNQLQKANLTEDNLVFGDVEQLDKKLNFDLFLTGTDPVLEMLSVRGRNFTPKRVLKVIPVTSIEEAEKIELSERNAVEMKFVTLNFFYYYREIPGIPPAVSGSRDFCKLVLSKNKRFTIDEIRNLPTDTLEEMGLPSDPFLYRGGFYHNPKTNITTPYCRHEWVLEVSYQ